MQSRSQPEIQDKRHKGWFWIEDTVLDIHGPVLGATGIAVYALLARHVGSDGKAFPSLHRFQILLGLSRNTVKKYLKLLASPEIGLIRIVERTSLNGDADSHIYELLSTYAFVSKAVDTRCQAGDLPGLPQKIRTAPAGHGCGERPIIMTRQTESRLLAWIALVCWGVAAAISGWIAHSWWVR